MNSNKSEALQVDNVQNNLKAKIAIQACEQLGFTGYLRYFQENKQALTKDLNEVSLSSVLGNVGINFYPEQAFNRIIDEYFWANFSKGKFNLWLHNLEINHWVKLYFSIFLLFYSISYYTLHSYVWGNNTPACILMSLIISFFAFAAIKDLVLNPREEKVEKLKIKKSDLSKTSLDVNPEFITMALQIKSFDSTAKFNICYYYKDWGIDSNKPQWLEVTNASGEKCYIPEHEGDWQNYCDLPSSSEQVLNYL